MRSCHPSSAVLYEAVSTRRGFATCFSCSSGSSESVRTRRSSRCDRSATRCPTIFHPCESCFLSLSLCARHHDAADRGTANLHGARGILLVTNASASVNGDSNASGSSVIGEFIRFTRAYAGGWPARRRLRRGLQFNGRRGRSLVLSDAGSVQFVCNL